jgi:hypothetical protein
LSWYAPYFECSESGKITQNCILDSDAGVFAVEITDRCFQTITALSDFAAVFEFKD